MRMTHQKARIADCIARIYVLEKKLENTEDLTLANIQEIIRQIIALEYRIDRADQLIDPRLKIRANGEKYISRIHKLNLGL